MVDEKLEVLFEVHQRISEEIGKSKMSKDGEWSDGHINGLKEANNRVETVIYETIEEEKLAEGYKEACGCE